MPALTKVVQKRCERDGCDWYGVPVTVGDACAGCGSPLAVKARLQTWVLLAAGGAVLVLALPIFLLLRPHSRLQEGPVTPTTQPPVAAHPLSQPSPQVRQTNAIQEASQAMSRGQKLADRGLYEDARLEFLRATEADPDNPMAWANLGAASVVTRRVEEARGAYDKALVLAPDNWLTHYNLAILLAREGDRDGAVRHLERFFALIGLRDEKRRKAIDDLRRDPALRGLVDDPRLRDLVAQTGGRL